MEPNIDNILVFATNIKTESDKQKVSMALHENTGILQWSIDQEDIDCVLRIESHDLAANQIIEIINNRQFSCTELE